jgi:hypothetical protein
LLSTVLPLSRERRSLTRSQHLALLDQRVEPLLGVALGQLHGRRDRHHRARRLVDHVADPAVAALGAADLRAFHEHDPLTGRGRRQAVHDLPQYGVRSVRQRPGSDDARCESTR